MKKLSIISACVALLCLTALFSFTNTEKQAPTYAFQQVTTIESVVPMGAGRSRMISTKDNGEMEETNMKNFFSAFGINFGNVRENDQMITDKVSTLYAEGWELVNTTSGVYSQGSDGGTGIFITRYLFRKAK